jgi:hypothetical protein
MRWQGKPRMQENDRRDANCPNSGQGIADEPPDLGDQASPARAQGLEILEAALHLGAHVLMVAKIFLDDVPAGRGKQARLFELCQFLVRQL